MARYKFYIVLYCISVREQVCNILNWLPLLWSCTAEHSCGERLDDVIDSLLKNHIIIKLLVYIGLKLL